MSPAPRLWESLAAPYRGGDLHECVRMVRAAVDVEPYELPPRYLLASLYLTLEEPGFALLQYERLLPLAVGRGELFLALAAQRRLDELHPKSTLHDRRYHAMHQWFVSLARTERRKRGAEAMRAFGPHVLTRLSAAGFAQAAARCRVESLGMEPRRIAAENGLLWIVLHGRVRWWVVREGESEPAPSFAEPGDFIVHTEACGSGVQLAIEPETPAECLCLDPELFAGVGAGTFPAEGARSAGEAAADEQVADLVLAAMSPLDVEALVADVPVEPAVSLPRAARPVPDPDAEPTVAVGAPLERRREHRLSVQAANRVVLLGLAGTRVAPLAGALVELSAHGMSVRFRRGDVLQIGGMLRDAVVAVHLVLPGDAGVDRLAARVVWVDREPTATDPESAFGLGLEFIAVGPALEARLARAASPGAATTAG